MARAYKQHRENQSDLCICTDQAESAFLSTKDDGLNFGTFQWRVENNFLEFLERQPCKAYPHFRKFHCFFFRKLAKSSVKCMKFRKIEQFLNFPEYFQGNLRIFRVVSIVLQFLGGTESAFNVD